MKRWKVWLLLFAVFLAGAVSGSVGTGLFVKHRIGQFIGSPEGRAPGFRTFERVIVNRLDLSSEQREAIDDILRRNGERFRSVLDKSRPQLGAIFKETVQEIRPFLTDRQNSRLDRILKRLEERRSRLRPPPPEGGKPAPPPPPPGAGPGD